MRSTAESKELVKVLSNRGLNTADNKVQLNENQRGSTSAEQGRTRAGIMSRGLLFSAEKSGAKSRQKLFQDGEKKEKQRKRKWTTLGELTAGGPVLVIVSGTMIRCVGRYLLL